jgi:formylglycine-generating enzyme required for sulfatase activity
MLSFAVLLGAEPQPGASTDPTGKPAWASSAGSDEHGTWSDLTVLKVTQRMRLIPSGTFTMGSPSEEVGQDATETEHIVTVTHGYWLADSTCMRAFWKVVMGSIQDHGNEEAGLAGRSTFIAIPKLTGL